MSSHGWHVYGYGVEVTGIKCDSIEGLQALIHLAPKLESDIEQWRIDNEIEIMSIQDYYDYDEECNLGLATIMKEVILELEGIEFTACDDLDGIKYLLFETTYPWYLTEKEKNLTADEIKNLLLKYFSMITNMTIKVYYYDPQNCG